MGTLRFILAMSVAYGHAGDFLGFPLIPGDTAVQSFYAVSGFYMALVLNQKYRPGRSAYSVFISNRFFRLFPVYAVVLCLTLLLAVAISFGSSKELPFVIQWRSLEKLDWPGVVFLVASQIIMWGQDLYLFLAVKNGTLVFWPDFHTAAQPAYILLPIPQSWTLGLEFSFYLIAPFIVRRSLQTIVLLLAVSLVLRLLLQFTMDYSGDPWSYRFFPSELAVFLVGVLGYRVYSSRNAAIEPRLIGIFLLAIACLGAALLINRWHGFGRVASVSFLMLTFALIPFLFQATKNQTLDRALGELSYPIYVCHMLLIWFLDWIAVFTSGLIRGAVIIAMTILMSIALYWWIDRPVDSWRQRRVDGKRVLALRMTQ